MFYRVHASIMKLLKYSGDLDYQLMEEHLDRVTKHEIYLDILEVDNAVVKGNSLSLREHCCTWLSWIINYNLFEKFDSFRMKYDFAEKNLTPLVEEVQHFLPSSFEFQAF